MQHQGGLRVKVQSRLYGTFWVTRLRPGGSPDHCRQAFTCLGLSCFSVAAPSYLMNFQRPQKMMSRPNAGRDIISGCSEAEDLCVGGHQSRRHRTGFSNANSVQQNRNILTATRQINGAHFHWCTFVLADLLHQPLRADVTRWLAVGRALRCIFQRKIALRITQHDMRLRSLLRR